MATAVENAPAVWIRRRADIALAGQILFLAAAYFISGRMGLALHAVSGFAAPVWPASGIALAALLLGGTRLWPGIAIGAFLLNLDHGASFVVAIGIAIGNTLEPVVGAYLLKLARFECGLARLRDVLSLVVLAGFISASVSATIGVTSLVVSGTVGFAATGDTWFAWFVGDGLSIMVITPFLITLAAGLPIPARRLEVAFAMATVLGCSLVFLGGFLPPGLHAIFGWPYLVYPALLWPSLRLGPRGTTMSTAIAASIAILATTLGRGIFAEQTEESGLLALQLFVGVMVVTQLSLAAAVAESRFRDEIMSIAAHELRGPVGTMSLAIDNMQDVMRRGESLADCTEAAEAAGRQCGRLARLVSELLDATRVGSHKLALHPAEVDLVALAKDVISRLQPRLKAAGCRVSLSTEPVRGTWDPLRIEQVLTNLLTNAIRHAPGAPIAVTVGKMDDRARLAVADSGPGIATRDQKRIFDAFRSLDRKGAGLGLGLHIVREIVVAHRGTIELDSQLGRGATFIVELPLQPDLRRRGIEWLVRF